jgi:hypothetical protein
MPSLHFPHARRPGGRAPLHPWFSRSALAVLLVAGAVGLAACGGSSGSAATTAAAGGTGTDPATTSTPTTTTGGAGGANAAAFTKYTSCLKQHGVTLPTRRPGGGGFGGGGGGGGGAPTGTTGTSTRPRGGGAFNNPKFRAAQTACAKLLPAGARGGFGGGRGGGFGGGAGNTAAFAAYRNCLTLHGVKLAAGAGGFGRPGANGGAKPTAKMTKALKACASLRPKFTGRPPTSTAPPTTTSS